jgi:hypothetical protein
LTSLGCSTSHRAAEEVRETQQNFNIQDAFPDLDRGIFGYTVDPQNPFRVLVFERWTATFTGEARIGPLKLKGTGKKVTRALSTI